MPPAAEVDPGPLASLIATLRLIVGWACFALGVLNLAMGLVSASYVVFHVVLIVTGLLLLATGRLRRRPSVVAHAAGGAAGVLGLVGTAIPRLAVECCSGAYGIRHGFPFTMLARDPGGWRFDLARTVADLVFWICAGFIVTVVVGQVRPAPDKPAGRRPVESPWRTPGHSEGRNVGRHAREARTADDENVGGLP
ncbi:hypothetical protein KOI35_05075 [Actinoplanes bogorensis]|uniref:Uncharacterized protein n=1 Tax=Paractinoplanes bogorensis TaxID=1610840 RepID=A0ABS5YHI9_9ACTN|nr:hypothetical protein [Actinoplanes bogorensis]MBU2662875.1 hypothetical protein [Actinoplanes bogorensis]